MDDSTNQENLIMILVTCGSDEEAVRLSEGLVRKHLAACVNIVPIRSIYEWQGKLENQPERLLIIKSLKARFEGIRQFVHDNHSYDLPEVIAMDISDSSSEYAGWIKAICGKGK